MRMLATTELYAGGVGSGCNPQAGRCGRKGRGTQHVVKLSDRARRALASYVPADRPKHMLAERNEKLLASLIKGQQTANNSPFDVLKGNSAIEVKTLTVQKNDKITMHPESLARKIKAARQGGLVPFTVVFDNRKGKSDVYYRKGVGSFRIGKMEKVNLEDLSRVL